MKISKKLKKYMIDIVQLDQIGTCKIKQLLFTKSAKHPFAVCCSCGRTHPVNFLATWEDSMPEKDVQELLDR